MAQSVSVDYRRKQASYWNAELALAVSLFSRGKVSARYLDHRVFAVTNLRLEKPPFNHMFKGQKVYSHD